MMLSPYTVTIYTKQDNPYNVIPDAPIEIRERLANGTSGSLSIIYSDQEGLIPITQTGAKADSNGQFTFYAEAAQYNAVYESQTVPVDIGLTADTLPSTIINNLSLPYVFDTVADMVASTITFPTGKTLVTKNYYADIEGGRATYIQTAGASPHVGSPAMLNGGYASIVLDGGIHNVKQFGARGDGVTDDNLKINDIMLIASAAQGTVYFPASTYICGQFDARSDITIIGDGFGSILKDNPEKVDPSENKVLMRLFGTSANPTDNIKNVTIRNMHFLGNVLGEGFKEFKHLLMIQGGTNIEISGCIFNGWQGDALVVRSGNNEYKNINIRVNNNIYDGANSDNRNAISITDVDGMWITDSEFKNCTRSNQPGAIDIEPNPTYSFVVLNHIVIRGNNFTNIGGNVACIGMYLPLPTEDFVVKPRNITVENNTMTNVYRGLNFTQLQIANAADNYPSMNIKCINNSVKGAADRGFWLYGMKGVTLRDNHFEDCANASRIGWIDPFRRCNDIEVLNNKFRHCGTVDGNAIVVYESDRLNFVDNDFDNCGVTAGGFGIPFTFAQGQSSKVKLIRNTIVNNEGLTTGAFSFSGGATLADGGNLLINNDFLSFDTSAFAANFTEYGENGFDTGITALGGGQGGAYQLTKPMNTVTGGAAFDSVKLPAATGLAKEVSISNDTAASIQVYPFSGDNLGKGVNSPESVATGTSITYKCYDNNNWLRSS